MLFTNSVRLRVMVIFLMPVVKLSKDVKKQTLYPKGDYTIPTELRNKRIYPLDPEQRALGSAPPCNILKQEYWNHPIIPIIEMPYRALNTSIMKMQHFHNCCVE